MHGGSWSWHSVYILVEVELQGLSHWSGYSGVKQTAFLLLMACSA